MPRCGSASSRASSTGPTRRVAPGLSRTALGGLPGAREPVEIPLHEEITTITQLMLLPEARDAHLPWLRTRLADYGADVRARLLAGVFLPSTAYVTGLRARRWAREEYERALGGYDLLVAPAMPVPAPRLDAIPADYRLLLIPYNSYAALLGLPVCVVPCGFVDGLPVGLALVGRPGGDGTPLAAARGIPAARPTGTSGARRRCRLRFELGLRRLYTKAHSPTRGLKPCPF